MQYNQTYSNFGAFFRRFERIIEKRLDMKRIRQNPKYNIKHREYTRVWKHEQRQSLITALGASCEQCGFNADILGLDLDHRNNNGKEDRLRFRRSWGIMWHYYLDHLNEAKQKLQILCGTCHRIKTSRGYLGKRREMEMYR